MAAGNNDASLRTPDPLSAAQAAAPAFPSPIESSPASASLPATPPASPPSHARIRFLAWLGLAGIAEFVLAVLALHAMTGDPNHLSDFARTQYAWLWVAGAYSFAVGGIALTIALQAHLPGGAFARAGLSLLWVASLGAVLIATFPTDSTPQAVTLSGTIHNDAVWPTFGSLGVAILFMGPALRSRRSWRRFADFSVVLGLLVCALGAAYVLTDTRGMALVAVVQRTLVALIACWFIILGVNLLFIRPRTPGAQADGPDPDPATVPHLAPIAEPAAEFRPPPHKT